MPGIISAAILPATGGFEIAAHHAAAHGAAAAVTQAGVVVEEDADRRGRFRRLCHARHFLFVERDVFICFGFAAEQAAEDAHAGHGVLQRLLAKVDEGHRDAGLLQTRDDFLVGR